MPLRRAGTITGAAFDPGLAAHHAARAGALRCIRGTQIETARMLMDAIYRVDGNRVQTSPNAAGPWDSTMQHGSAPAALVTWAAEAIPTSVPMQIVRVTIDLLRPVPV